MTKYKHAEAFPSQRNQVNGIFAVRSEHFAYFCASAPSGNDSTRRSALVKAGLWNDLTSSSIASSPLAVITNLGGRKKDARRHCERVDEICKRRDVHLARISYAAEKKTDAARNMLDGIKEWPIDFDFDWRGTFH